MRDAPTLSDSAARRSLERSSDEREFEMSDAEFRRIAQRVFAVAGIVLKDHKRQMVYTRLARRLRARGLTSFGSYMDLLESPAGRSELQAFTNAVTTNLTSFFREGHHFDHLRDSVVGPRVASGQRKVRIWSAGCSTGEEPYSIAMTLLGKGTGAPLDLKILATDLDTDVLARAASGLYRAERADDVPPALRSRALLRRPPDQVEIAPALQAPIAFRRLNLLETWPFSGPFDAIFCRNVLIYFDADTKARLVRRFAEMLDKNGALYLGHSESLLGEHPMLRSEGRTIYRRRG